VNVAIIPARGGSRRIPHKNIRPFLGKPIIGRSIETALASGCFAAVIVSTDDPEIAEISRGFGAETPFTRPAELADDLTPTLPVIHHAVTWLDKEGRLYKNVCCIYPTAPLLQPHDIVRGLEILVASGADYAITCCAFDFPVRRAVRINDDGLLTAEFPEDIDKRSQELVPLYHDAGQIYWGTAHAYRAMTPFFGGRAAPVVMPRDRVQDIDDLEDWRRAEFLSRWITERDNEQN
jgi:pseudaminic acid cytidylyltransferase